MEASVAQRLRTLDFSHYVKWSDDLGSRPLSEHVTDEMQYIQIHSGSGVIRWSVHFTDSIQYSVILCAYILYACVWVFTL